MIEVSTIYKLLPESMFYPCSEDDGTPIKRCKHLFPLYIYVDYSIPKEKLINRLKYHRLVCIKEFTPEEFFGRSWDVIISEYKTYIEKLPFEFKDPYILGCEFEHEISGEKIITVRIKFEGIAMLEELYIKRGIKPKGLAHLRCGVGFGGNYHDYVRILNEKLLNNPAGLPEFILCDSLCSPFHADYLPVIKKYKPIRRWRYFRPAYNEHGIDTLYRIKQVKRYSLVELLKMVNVSGKDDGRKFLDPTRRNVIIDICKENEQLELLYKDDYVLLFTTGITSSGDILLISCHIDHVFRPGELCIRQEGEWVIGTLDNSACIACLLYALQEYKFPRNVIISFTGGEENKRGCLGAKTTRDCLEDKFDEIYSRLGIILNLDITPYNFDKDVSLENLSIEKENFENAIIRFSSVKEFKNKLLTIMEKNNLTAGVIVNSEPDESRYYKRWDFNTVSLCLTCKCPRKNCHSRECKTTLDKMEKFAKAIKAIADEIFKQEV
ncbi:MAG: M28 family peptidase [Endomicrobiia bacterium]